MVQPLFINWHTKLRNIDEDTEGLSQSMVQNILDGCWQGVVY